MRNVFTAWQHRRASRSSAPGYLWIALILLTASAVYAQDPRARANPCATMQEQAAGPGRHSRNLQVLTSRLFYNGVDLLAAPPDKPLRLPAEEFSGDWRATCVMLQIVFRGQGENLTAEVGRSMGMFPTRSNEYAMRHERIAIDIARQIPFGKVLPRQPQAGTPYLIAIPLWPDHALYQPGAKTFTDVAKTLSDDLKPMGYGTVPKLHDRNGVAVYRVADLIRKGHTPQFLFVVVRDVGENDPIIQYEAHTNPYGQKVWRYTGVVDDIFRANIAPVLSDTDSRVVSVEVRHYARGMPFKVDDSKTAPIFERAGDWNTRNIVDHPIFVARYVGRRANAKAPFEWHSEETQKIAFSTLAEARKLDAQYNIPDAERARQQTEAQEKARQRAAEQEAIVSKEQREMRGRTDPGNALASLGYPDATVLLRHDRTSYYASQVTPQKPVVVAVSEIGEDDPVVDLVRLDDGSYRYSNARIALVREKLIPAMLSRWPDLRAIAVHHHVRGVPLDDMPEFRKWVRSQGLKYEQPVFVEEYGFNQGETLWRPMYEVGTWSRTKSIQLRPLEYSVSVADARQLRAKKLEDARVAGLDADALKAELLQKRMQAQAQRPKQYVYKSDRFWARLPQFYIPRNTFNGDFSAFQINRQFPSHFLAFLSAYSKHCESLIKQDTYKEYTFITVTITYDNYGFEKSRSAGKPRKLYVDWRFDEKYKEYDRAGELRALGDILSMVFSTDGADRQDRFLTWTFDQVKGKLAEIIAWNRFFEGHACTGPTITQMRENILRAATGQPSLQSANLAVANAVNESEPLVPPAGTATIFDACYHDHAYKESQLCVCIDDRSKSQMRTEEIQKYSQDFSLFYKENIFPNKQGPGDPRWRLHNLHAECTKRRRDQGTL